MIVLAAGCAYAPHSEPEILARGHEIVASSGVKLSDVELGERLRAAKVVYIGEQHSSANDHAAERELLEKIYATDASLAVGLEMLSRTMQKSIDDYLSGVFDEAQFLAAVDWKKTWGFDYAFYRPLFSFCREHHLRMFALNLPREITHRVAKEGIAALSTEERSLLPEIVSGPAAHRERIRQIFAAHPHVAAHGGPHGVAQSPEESKEAFERFYAAQLLWDETMAEEIARALASPDAPAKMLVVAGEMHVRRDAVVERATRRGVQPALIVLPLFARDLKPARRENLADLYWVFLR